MADSDSTQELFELFQRMLNPMAAPFQHLLSPSLSVEDIDKKISNLQTIETWLKANLSMLELSIKSLQYQRALLVPPSGSEAAKTAAANPFLDPKLWPWNPANFDLGKSSEEPAPKKKTGRKKS
jgi:hypothetical protein